jgi:hypothetical protein
MRDSDVRIFGLVFCHVQLRINLTIERQSFMGFHGHVSNIGHTYSSFAITMIKVKAGAKNSIHAAGGKRKRPLRGGAVSMEISRALMTNHAEKKATSSSYTLFRSLSSVFEKFCFFSFKC